MSSLAVVHGALRKRYVHAAASRATRGIVPECLTKLQCGLTSLLLLAALPGDGHHEPLQLIRAYAEGLQRMIAEISGAVALGEWAFLALSPIPPNIYIYIYPMSTLDS